MIHRLLWFNFLQTNRNISGVNGKKLFRQTGMTELFRFPVDADWRLLLLQKCKNRFLALLFLLLLQCWHNICVRKGMP